MSHCSFNESISEATGRSGSTPAPTPHRQASAVSIARTPTERGCSASCGPPESSSVRHCLTVPCYISADVTFFGNWNVVNMMSLHPIQHAEGSICARASMNPDTVFTTMLGRFLEIHYHILTNECSFSVRAYEHLLFDQSLSLLLITPQLGPSVKKPSF